MFRTLKEARDSVERESGEDVSLIMHCAEGYIVVHTQVELGQALCEGFEVVEVW